MILVAVYRDGISVEKKNGISQEILVYQNKGQLFLVHGQDGKTIADYEDMPTAMHNAMYLSVNTRYRRMTLEEMKSIYEVNHDENLRT